MNTQDQNVSAKEVVAILEGLPSSVAPLKIGYFTVEEAVADFKALEAIRRRFSARHFPSRSRQHVRDVQTERVDEFGRTVSRRRVDEEVEE